MLRQPSFDSIKAAYYAVSGREIFQQNCTSCHRINSPATGPALAGVTRRRTDAWLRKWIANPSKMIADGDPTALRLHDRWNRTSMTSFPFEPVYMDKLIAYLHSL